MLALFLPYAQQMLQNHVIVNNLILPVCLTSLTTTKSAAPLGLWFG